MDIDGTTSRHTVDMTNNPRSYYGNIPVLRLIIAVTVDWMLRQIF